MADLIQLAIELIPSISAPAVAVFAVWLTFRWQDKHERGKLFKAITNEVIENEVMLKKLEIDLNLEAEHVKKQEYKVASFIMLQRDSWLLLKTSKILHTLDEEKYVKIIRYYAYVADLNAVIQTRNTFVFMTAHISTDPIKVLSALLGDIRNRIEIVREKAHDLEQVLKELS